MEKEFFYVKSFEEDFFTKTLINNKKTNFQSIKEVVKKKVLKPNTKSFGRQRRLSCTIISKQNKNTRISKIGKSFKKRINTRSIINN